ncbi:MAG TPA: 3-oxoacyl-[acyl-carrier-protein] reductase [Bacilli bacterium]
MNLNNKIAIVTGGATGIGREIAKKLASLGATVIINYNSSSQEAMALVNELEQSNLKADCIQANVANFDEAFKLIDYAVSKYGKLDILVNNAGITADNLIIRMNENDFDKVINVNLKGTWNCCKHATKVMMKARSGKIINISSIVGLVGNFGQTNYSASKAGIIGLTKSLAKEVATRGINVNAVAPGFIKTKMTDVLDENLKQKVLENIPLNRLGEAEDVANVVAFLASDLANYLTGQVINVDGGLVMN